jgi:serine/threonine protein phosphatase PrpC
MTTWIGTTVGMVRGRGVAATATSGGVLCRLGKKSSLLSSRGTSSTFLLGVSAARRKFVFGVPKDNHSYSFWSGRGGEIGTGDFTTNEKGSSSSFSSSSSASPSSDTSNDNSKSNSRTLPSSSSSSSLSPITGSHTQHTYQISVGTEQGFRSYMEDEYYVSNDGDFAAVFDGHGGRAVSRYLRKNLYANVQAFLPLVVLEEKQDNKKRHNNNKKNDDDDDDDTDTNDNKIEQINIENHINNNNLSSSPPPSSSSPQSLPTSLSSSSSTRRPRNPTIDDYANALESALEKVDSEILKISHWSFQGSTAVVIWLHEEEQQHDEQLQHDGSDNGNSNSESSTTNTSTSTSTTQRTILAANIGDSRAVLCRNNKAWDLSRDHKPNDPDEKSRIESLGGSVVWCGDTDKFGKPIEDQGIYRVNGNLALSRAIGDRSERPHVTAEPEIISVPIEEGDQFIVVATDGLWDVMDSDDAVNYVNVLLESGVSRKKVATLMVQEAMRLGTYDNVTVVIIWMDSI